MTSSKALALALLLLPVIPRAQGVPLRTVDSSELGVEVSSYRYEEQVGNAFFMGTEGNKVGLLGRFSQALPDDWFWGADARQAHGNVVYQNATTPKTGSNPDVITELRITGGHDFVVGQQVLAPYFGLGYRHLFNDLRGYTTTSNAGYRRTSEYVYLPVGVTHRFRLSPQTRLSTTLEYDLLLDGRQQSFLSDVNASSNNPINTQRQGHGLKLMASYETLHWGFGVAVHHWSIADSDLAAHVIGGIPQLPVMEPQNTTREVSLSFRLRFH